MDFLLGFPTSLIVTSGFS
ncbi:hypothetical protein BsWGS_05552 [Bradybaena similaris]